MPNLASTDWLILLIYLFCVLAIGFSLRLNIKTSKDYFQAGRALPSVICALAFIAASLGLQEVIGMAAAGAEYGLKAALFFSLGGIPALLFAGVYMMPLYYGSGARTVPEYLGLRFDQKTRLFNAGTFAVTTIATAGISLFLLARIFQALHLFDSLFYAYGLPHQGIFSFCVLLASAVVLAYLLFAGLAGAMVNQVLQFLLIVAAFLPLTISGLNNIGGWQGLKTALPAALPLSAYNLGPIPTALLCLLAGLVLTAGHWCTDFRLLQNAMAAKDIESARRIPLVAAAVRLFLPFLLILPGAIAIVLPTPHSTTVVKDESGAIYHEITVVPPDEAQGQGLVPAHIDLATNKPLLDSAGHTLLNYDRATPEMLTHILPSSLLGLGIAALLASLMSGLAAGISALIAVFTNDIYRPFIRKEADEIRFVKVGRFAAIGAILLSIGVAYAISASNGIGMDNGNPFDPVLYPLMLSFSIVTAPQLATFLLGMFWKHATSRGAFAGLAAGTAAAILHQGLTLPLDSHAGFNGGWIAVAHHYPGIIAQCFWTAIAGFAVNAIVTIAVSLKTPSKTGKELKGLVHSLTRTPKAVVGKIRPVVMAALILLAAIALSIFFI